MADRDAARAARSQVSALVQGNDRVNGVGLRRRTGSWVVKVNLVDEDRSLRRRLPREVGGVPVEIEVVGTITARAG